MTSDLSASRVPAADLRPITVAISGSSGLVGSALTAALIQRHDRVISIVRSLKPGDTESLHWDPKQGILNAERLAGVDTVVHLAGENIAAGRWNQALKQRIRDSRVVGTRNLVKSLAAAAGGPRTLICASAIGYYGDRSDEQLTEDSTAGSGFLPDVCREWEHEALAAGEHGIRVVCVRIGVVLTPKGGALAKMLLPFKLGLGGVVGSGQQYWSWIGLNDLVRAFVHCLDDSGINGPVNAVSPETMTNRDFTRVLGQVLHRPTIFPMPAFAARLALGEMADALLLPSARVLPTRLNATGFQFEHPDLKSCLEYEMAVGRT